MGEWEDLAKEMGPAPKGATASSEDAKLKLWEQPTAAAQPEAPYSLKEFITSPHGLVRQGLGQAYEGVKTLTGYGKEPPSVNSFMGAGSNIIRGLGTAMLPAAIPFAVANPISAGAAALGGATGAGAAGMVSRALGGSDEATNLAQDVGGLVGGGLGQKLPNAMRVDPRIAVARSLRPPPSDPGFPQRIPQTLQAVKAVNPGYKPAIEDGQLNLVKAANKAISAHQEMLQPWLDRMEGTRVSGQPIVDATREAVSGMLPSEQAAGQALVERAQQDYRDFTPKELRDRLSLLNERLSPFYKGSPSKQSAALADIPESVLKAQRDATADTLYKHLDPENAGEGPRRIQSATGDIIHLRDSALNRNNAIVAEQPLTPLGKIVDPIKGAIRAVMPGKATGAGIAFAEGSEGRSLPLLRRAFNATDPAAGANALGSLPQPGPRQIAAPPDTSGPLPAAARDFGSVGAPNPRAPRGLLGSPTPGYPSPIITPPPPNSYPGQGPSGSFPSATPITENTGRMLTAAPPAPIKQPGFGVQDMVPIRDPKTGKVTYISRQDLRDMQNARMPLQITPDMFR